VTQLLMRALRRSAPGLTRAVVSTVLNPERRRAVVAALARLEAAEAPTVIAPGRHPLTPAAVRIERSRSRRRRGDDEQVAVTMWFGEGPALPGAGGNRRLARAGAGVLSAAAVAAATTLVARLGERPPPRAIATRPPAPRLPAGPGSGEEP
jgi:hypothetical protein